MKKIQEDTLLRGFNFFQLVFIELLFIVTLHYFYRELFIRHGISIYLLYMIFAVLYVAFGKIYGAFMTPLKKTSEIIYSQCLSAFLTDAVLFVVIWILLGGWPNLMSLFFIIITQGICSVAYSVFFNQIYFLIYPAEPTAVIYDNENELHSFMKKYGKNKRYDIKLIMNINDCVKDLSVLDIMKNVLVTSTYIQNRNTVLKYCIRHNIHAMVIPCIGDIIMSIGKPIPLCDFTVLTVNWNRESLGYRFIKCAMDILLSLAGLIVLSPLMVTVGIMIKLYDGGPVLYSQARLTKDRKRFIIYKFRSMTVNAEMDGVARLSSGEHDVRVTPVGRIIRKTRIDELPQLFNILKGDLSIVGPRPERPEIAEQYESELPEFAMRLQVKAGLTGYAQVYGKYNTTPQDKLRMDLMYIADHGIIMDIKIIIATVRVLFMPESTEGVGRGKTTALVKYK